MKRIKLLTFTSLLISMMFITGCNGSRNSSALQWNIINTSKADLNTNTSYPSIAFSNTKINGQQFLYYTSSTTGNAYVSRLSNKGAPIIRYNFLGNNMNENSIIAYIPLMPVIESIDKLLYAPLSPKLQISNGNLYATALYTGDKLDGIANTFIFYCGAVGLLDAECLPSDVLVSKTRNADGNTTSNNFLVDQSNNLLYLVQGVGQIGGVVYGVNTDNKLHPKFTTSELAIIPPEPDYVNFIRSSIIDNQHHLWISTLRSNGVTSVQEVKIYEFQLNGLNPASLLKTYDLDLDNFVVGDFLLSQSIVVGNNNSIYLTLLSSGNPYTYIKNVNDNTFTLQYSGVMQHNNFDNNGAFLKSAWYNNKLYNATMNSSDIDTHSTNVSVFNYVNQGNTYLAFNNPIVDNNIYSCNYSTLLSTNIGLFFASTCGTPFSLDFLPIQAFTIQLLK